MRLLCAALLGLALVCPPGASAQDGTARDDELRSGSGSDEVEAGAGDDLVSGGSGGDRLEGEAGHDLLVDTQGNDRVSAGPGRDRISVRDGAGGDRVSCGAGSDQVLADPGDRVARDCERVLVRSRRAALRRDVADLSGAERRRFVDAVLALKSTPSPYDRRLSWYDQFVAWHEDAFEDEGWAAHGGPGFLPWHRQFLLLFEDALQAASGTDVALPYWDWTDQRSTRAVFSDEVMGPSGDPKEAYAVTRGPFRRGAWRLFVREESGVVAPFDPGVGEQPREGTYLERALGTSSYARRPPTAAGVAAILGQGEFDTAPWSPASPLPNFRNPLEGFAAPPGGTGNHNSVHVFVGGNFRGRGGDFQSGTMGLATSPNDPVFWLHHNNVDRMWAAWARTGGQIYLPESGAPRGHNRGDVMRPFDEIGIRTTPARLLDPAKLGFRYAQLPPAGPRASAASPDRAFSCVLPRAS